MSLGEVIRALPVRSRHALDQAALQLCLVGLLERQQRSPDRAPSAPTSDDPIA